MARREGSFLRLGLGIAVVVVIVAGLLVVDSPMEQRRKNHDTQRIQNLSSIENAVGDFFKSHERLPSDLDELAGWASFRLSIDDPITGRRYDYEVLAEKEYRLCAVFEVSEDEFSPRALRWDHGAGHDCFGLNVTRMISD